MYKSRVSAQDLWLAICNAQIETGTPYILYKDACNLKSNQQNLGTIKSSNLCCEIIEYTNKDEIAVCNLASICLPQFVNTKSSSCFDHEKLHYVAQVITRNLNKVIDNSYYPVSQAEHSNKKHRPIGIGVQGLADVYQMIGIEFDSEEAAQLNEDIFETIYHAAMTSSMEEAKKYGPYETFEGSPLSKGIFQFDLWNTSPRGTMNYDWDSLKESVKTFGCRNSLLLAPMPTATTSQIMGNNEAIEPYTSNLYLRRTIAGEFRVINKHLVKQLQAHNLWDKKMKDLIIYHEGSVQKIDSIPQYIKNVFKTAWELSQKILIDQAASRGKYVCQSQSLNLFVPVPNIKILSSMHFYGWSCGLKTGIYYLRTKPAANAIQFTIDPSACTSCSA
jgi:ribonucleoside-diphosphate reductase alpha chain